MGEVERKGVRKRNIEGRGAEGPKASIGKAGKEEEERRDWRETENEGEGKLTLP